MTSSTDVSHWDPTPDLEWLTALARRLAHPGEDADDLAQQTWLVAIQHERPQGSSRPWLAGVLRNLRRMHARTDGRRRARERDVEPPEPATPEAAMQQLETLEALHAALTRLDPVDRKLLLGRYANGQSAVELGQQLGLPASTVRTKLARARERLRNDVQSQRGLGCFAPWVMRGGEGSVATSVAVAGGVTMKTMAYAGLGLAAIVAVGVGLQQGATTAPPPPDDDAIAPERRTVATASAVKTDDRSTRMEAIQRKRERIHERREQRARVQRDAAQGTAALAKPVPTADGEGCEDGCIGTLSMQLEIAEAIAGCRDGVPEGVRGKARFRAHVLAEPGIGAVVDTVEVIENTIDDDFAECILHSAPLAELGDPEYPIADSFVFRYTVGSPPNPATEFLVAHPDLVAAYPEIPELVDIATLDPTAPLSNEQAMIIARWLDTDVEAQTVFARWITEEGTDLAKIPEGD